MTGSREINQTEDGEILSSTVTGGAEKPLSVLGSIILTVFFFFNNLVFPCKPSLKRCSIFSEKYNQPPPPFIYLFIFINPNVSAFCFPNLAI